MFDQRYKVPGRVMVSDTPFTHLQTFPIVNDGTTDMPIDLRKFVSVSGAECSHGDCYVRRSLDEGQIWNGGSSCDTFRNQCMERSHTLANPCDVGEMLSQINSCKLVGQDSQSSALHSAVSIERSGSTNSSGGPTTISDGLHHNLKWIQPSGARQPGQGCEDVEQGIVFAEQTHTGGAIVRITLLAAGFIIGPSGSSVRDICRMCGTDIKSWTCEPDRICIRPTRQFRVEGLPLAVARSLEVMCDAVQRYKELCEGKYAGQAVPRIQHVSGIEFSYQPPPRNIVPYAASLKSQGSGKRPGGGRPPAAPTQKDALGRTASLGLFPAAGPSPIRTPSKSTNLSLSRSHSLPPLPQSQSTLPSPGKTAAVQPRAGQQRLLCESGGKGIKGKLDSRLESDKDANEDSLPSTAAAIVKQASSSSEQNSSPSHHKGHQHSSSPFEEQAASMLARKESVKDIDEGGANIDCNNRERRTESSDSGVHGTHPPAAARTLGKTEVMRRVFSGYAQRGESANSITSHTVPYLLQQLALQQHQQQLAAAAAQGGFPIHSTGACLSDLAGVAAARQGLSGNPICSANRLTSGRQGPLQGIVGGWGNEEGASGMGAPGRAHHDQQQALLVAAMAALGLTPGSSGGDVAQQARQALLGLAAGGSIGGDLETTLAWQSGCHPSSSPVDYNFMQLAKGLIPPAPSGPGTPTPTPITATLYPSPEQQQQQQQQHVLAALQALASTPSPSFGTAPRWSGSAHGSPGSSQRNSEDLLQGPLSASPILPHSAGFQASLAAAASTGLLESSASAKSAGNSARAVPSEMPPFAPGPLYSAFGSPGIFAQSTGASLFESAGSADDQRSFLSDFRPCPALSGFSLSRASSLALAEGPTQPSIAATTESLGSVGRSLSLPSPGPFHEQSVGNLEESLTKWPPSQPQCYNTATAQAQLWRDLRGDLPAAVRDNGGAEGEYAAEEVKPPSNELEAGA